MRDVISRTLYLLKNHYQILIMAVMAVVLVLQRMILTDYYKKMLEKSKEMAEKERLISEMKSRIMLSQMQPHFLYNCLNTIYYLCGSDPKKAQEAVSDFSDYLRANMDSLRKDGLVSFREELQHVKKYLSLEAVRYGDGLKVKYDLETDDFALPVLTLQPIV